MRNNARSLISKIVITVLVLGIIGYGVFAARDLIRGPYIEIRRPIDGFTTASSTIAITGLAKRVQAVTINDFPIPISTEGDFNETIFLHPGNNTISIKAHDKFGKKISTTLSLVRKID